MFLRKTGQSLELVQELHVSTKCFAKRILIRVSGAFASCKAFAAEPRPIDPRLRIWVGPQNGEWTNPSNWAPASVPGATEMAFFGPVLISEMTALGHIYISAVTLSRNVSLGKIITAYGLSITSSLGGPPPYLLLEGLPALHPNCSGLEVAYCGDTTTLNEYAGFKIESAGFGTVVGNFDLGFGASVCVSGRLRPVTLLTAKRPVHFLNGLPFQGKLSFSVPLIAPLAVVLVRGCN